MVTSSQLANSSLQIWLGAVLAQAQSLSSITTFPTFQLGIEKQTDSALGQEEGRLGCWGGGGMQVGRWEGLGCMWNREEDGTQVGLR